MGVTVIKYYLKNEEAHLKGGSKERIMDHNQLTPFRLCCITKPITCYILYETTRFNLRPTRYLIVNKWMHDIGHV